MLELLSKTLGVSGDSDGTVELGIIVERILCLLSESTLGDRREFRGGELGKAGKLVEFGTEICDPRVTGSIKDREGSCGFDVLLGIKELKAGYCICCFMLYTAVKPGADPTKDCCSTKGIPVKCPPNPCTCGSIALIFIRPLGGVSSVPVDSKFLTGKNRGILSFTAKF